MQLPGKDKLYLGFGLVGALLALGLYSSKSLRPDAPLTLQPLSESGSPIASPPTEAAPAEGPKPAPKEVVVAMAGAVKVPGLLHLPPDARIDDAIKAAGGAKPDADLEAINLAAKAVDGDQIYVPHKKAEPAAKAEESTRVVDRYRGGEVKTSYSSQPLQPPMPSTLKGSLHVTKATASGPVSLNTGSEAQLESLPGVGPATAQKILDYRQEHGGFTSIDEIQMVKGIGPKKFAKMKPFLKL